MLRITGFQPKTNFLNHIAIADGEKAVALFGPMDEDSLKVARRFLACVNAFEGVADEDIEEAGRMARKLFSPGAKP